jgi:hypothetical protein
LAGVRYLRRISGNGGYDKEFSAVASIGASATVPGMQPSCG